MCFQKWHEKFYKFSPERLKVSKLGLSWHAFVQSRKYKSLKFTGELCVTTMKNDAKIERGINLSVKNWHEVGADLGLFKLVVMADVFFNYHQHEI